MCFSATLPTNPILSFHHCVHNSVLYVRVSIPAQLISSPVPFFWIPYTCINLQYLLFSFWCTSLCVTGSSFIQTSVQITQLWSFLWLHNIPLYMCSTTSLSVDGHLGCFHMAIVNSVAMNTGVHVSIWVVFLVYMPSSGIALKCMSSSCSSISENKQPSQKMDRKLKQTFLQRKHTDRQQTHEKILSISHY